MDSKHIQTNKHIEIERERQKGDQSLAFLILVSFSQSLILLDVFQSNQVGEFFEIILNYIIYMYLGALFVYKYLVNILRDRF